MITETEYRQGLRTLAGSFPLEYVKISYDYLYPDNTLGNHTSYTYFRRDADSFETVEYVELIIPHAPTVITSDGTIAGLLPAPALES